MKDQHTQGSGAYRQSDVEVVFSRGNWQNWHDVIHWLEENGEQDNELTKSEVNLMIDDLRTLDEKGVPFTQDPEEVFDEINRYYESE